MPNDGVVLAASTGLAIFYKHRRQHTAVHTAPKPLGCDWQGRGRVPNLRSSVFKPLVESPNYRRLYSHHQTVGVTLPVGPHFPGPLW